MTTTDDLPLLLTATQVSKYIMPVHARSLKRWHAAGLIEGTLSHGKWRYYTPSLLKHLGITPQELPAKPRRGRPRKTEVIKEPKDV